MGWGGGVGSAGIEAMRVRVGGARMRKGDVCFRGRRCAGHLKISFVAAEKKKGEREETRRGMTNKHKMDSKIGQKRRERGRGGDRGREREGWG